MTGIFQLTVKQNDFNISIVCYYTVLWAGIPIRYGLGGPGIESLWGASFYLTRSDRVWILPILLCNGYRFIPLI